MTTPKPASAPQADAVQSVVAEMKMMSCMFPKGAVHIVDVIRWAEALAASAQVREVEPKPFGWPFDPPEPKPAPEPGPVAQGDGIDWRGFGKYSTEQVVAGLTNWMHDQMEREAWNDTDRSTYRYCAGLLQKAIATIADHARREAEAAAEIARHSRNSDLQMERAIRAEASLAACRALLLTWRESLPRYDNNPIRKNTTADCADELEKALRQEAPHAD